MDNPRRWRRIEKCQSTPLPIEDGYRKMKSSPRLTEEGNAEMESSPSLTGKGKGMKSSSQSTEEDRSSFKRKVRCKVTTKAYFRTLVGNETTTPIHWYSFDIGKEDGADLKPVNLTPFSKVNQPFHSTVVGMNSFIYCLGGRDLASRKYLNCVYRYDTANPDKAWEKMSDMIHGRTKAQALVVQGKIYVMGGHDPESVQGRIIQNKFAEFYDPRTDKWTTLIVHYDGKNMYPNSILNPEENFMLNYIVAVVDPSHILLALNNNPSYLLDVRDHCLRKLEGQMFIDRSSQTLIDGYTQYVIHRDSGMLRRLRMDKNIWDQSTKPFSVGHEHFPNASSCSLLREDGLFRSSDYAKQFHIIWYSGGKNEEDAFFRRNEKLAFGVRNEKVALNYRNIKFLDPNEVNGKFRSNKNIKFLEEYPNEVNGKFGEYCIRSTKCYFIPMGQSLISGLLL